VSASSPDPSTDTLRQVGVPVASAPARPKLGPTRRARAWEWARAHPVLCAAGIYLLMSVVFVGQGLVPGRTLSSSDMLWSTAPWTSTAPHDVRWGGANFELADAITVFQPFFQHSRSVLPDVPLWNSHVMGGRPFLANAQAAIYSPFSLPAYVLPFWKSLAVIAILKLFAGAFGTFLFARALGMRFAGALAAGTVFAFGTFFVVWLAWPLTNIFPLIPWLFLVAELMIRRPDLLTGAALAGLVALAFFGGHPETTFHSIVATALYFAFRAGGAWRRGGEQRRTALRAAVAFPLAIGGGAALAGILVIPLVEALVHSGDYARRLTWAPGHAEVHYLPTLLLFDYWGRPTQTPLAGIVSNRGYYAGGVTLMLVAGALVLRPTPIRIGFAALGALALAVVLGVDPIFTIVTHLPGFRTAHNGRLVIFFLFALAMLAGWGVDELSRPDRPPRARRAVAIGAAAVIFCAPIAGMLAVGAINPGKLGSALHVAWGFADPPPPPGGPARDADILRAAGNPVPGSTVDIIRLSALLQWLVLAGAGLVLVVLLLGGVGRFRVPRAWPAGALVGLVIVVLVADLFRANMGFNPAIPIDHAKQPSTPALRYLQAQAPNRFAGFDRPGIGQPLQPNLSMRYGLYDARGYDYPVLRRYDNFWRATAAPPGDFIPPTGRAEPTVRSLRGMSLLSVTDIMQDPHDPQIRLPGLQVAYSGPDARIYRNLRAVPRAFLVGRQRVVDGGDAALAATVSPTFDARTTAVTERAVPGLPQAGGTASPGSARLVGYGDERAVVRATARQPSLLVLTDVNYPGWKATVDGRPAAIERVDYLLRGVAIPAGSHTVEFRYAPLSWRIGWIVSSVAALAFVAALVVGWRRRRVQPRGPGP
jgi:Bacterial membrane protein YfhO